jgi:hypothetical protein
MYLLMRCGAELQGTFLLNRHFKRPFSFWSKVMGYPVPVDE